MAALFWGVIACCHALLTWVVVGAGQWIGGRVSEKMLDRLSGELVLVSACSP